MPLSPNVLGLYVICFWYLIMIRCILEHPNFLGQSIFKYFNVTMLLISYYFLLQVKDCKHVWIRKQLRFYEKWKLQVNIAKSIRMKLYRVKKKYDKSKEQ